MRLVLDHQGEHDSQWSAITSVSSKLGCTAETLRKWVRQGERDRGVRAGLSSEERRRLKELERENRELRRANEILRKVRIPVKPITHSGLKPITESGQADHQSERSDAGR